MGIAKMTSQFIVEDGMLLKSVCCQGYDWEVLYVYDPSVGSVWGKCLNPDCPVSADDDLYHGIDILVLEDLEAILEELASGNS